MAVCVAGMHRSGTSMVTRLLNLSGVYLGAEKDLLAPTADNAEGFWEHRRFVELNDAILEELGAGWDSPPTPAAWAAALLRRHLQKGALIIDAFRDHQPWGWKDPRNSLTLPFWQQLVSPLKVIICLRNPLEVALSLRARNYCSYAHSLTLWVTYNKSLIAHTRPEDRLVTHYDRYFVDPAVELRRMLQFLGVPDSEALAQQASLAAKPALRHHELSTADLVNAGASNEVLNLYLTLCAASGAPQLDQPSASAVVAAQTARVDASTIDAASTQGGGERATDLTIGALEAPAPIGRLRSEALELDVLRREHKGLEATHLALQQQFAAEVLRRGAAAKDLQASLDEQTALAGLRAREAEERGERIKQLEAQRAQMTASLADLQSQLLSERERMREARALADALEARVRELADARAQAEARVSELTDARAESEARVSELTDACAQSEARVSELTDARAQSEARVSELSDACAESEARVRELTAGDAQAMARLTRLETEIEKRDVAITELEKAIDDKDAAWAQSLRDAAARDRLVAGLQSRLQELLTIQGELTSRIAQSESEARGLHAVLDERRAFIQHLTDEGAARDGLSRELREALESQTKEAHHLQSRLEELLRTQGELTGKVAQSESEARGLHAVLDERRALIQHLTDEGAARDGLSRELREALERQAADGQRRLIDLAGRDVPIRLLEPHSERSIEEARRRDSVVRDLQLELAERSAWAFRMVEELMQLQLSKSGAAFGQGTAVVPARGSDFTVIADPQHLQDALRQRTAQVASLRDDQASVEAALAAARETTAGLDAALREEQALRQDALRQQTAQVASLRDDLVSVEAALTAACETAAGLDTALREEQAVRCRLEEAAKRDYEHLKQRLLESMDQVIPKKATVLMVSGGDDALVGASGLKVWHFPQTEDGVWAGQNPADSAAAIAHLEALRAKGAAYFVLPATSRWWLDQYHDFRTHFRRYRMVLDREDTGTIVDVTEPAWQRRLRNAIVAFEERFGREPALLDWDSGLDLAAVFPAHAVFSPPVASSTLVYLDGSVDIAVCPRRSPLVAEARRVASGMVVTVSRPRTNGRSTEAKSDGRIRVRIESIAQAAPAKAVRRGRSGSSGARPTPVLVPRAEEKSRKGQR